MPRRILLFSALVVSVVIAIVLFWPRATSKSTLAGASSVESQTSKAVAIKGSTKLAPPKEPSTAIARFSQWSEIFTNTPSANLTADLMTEGAELARDRRAEMADLIKRDPKAALEAAVPMAVRQQLPQAILDQLEERVSGRGFYGVLVATDFENMTSQVRRELVVGNRTFQAYVF